MRTAILQISQGRFSAKLCMSCLRYWASFSFGEQKWNIKL